MVSTALGDRIRKLRKEKGFTLDKLAELSDASKSYIWELENKNPPRPSAEKLSKIAAALGVTIEYLMGGDADLTEEKAVDTHFYREYLKMDPAIKQKIRQMMDLLKDDD